MTGRFLGLDVRDKIITMLNDVTTGFNVLIGTINTERTHTAPLAEHIGYDWGQNDSYLIRVEMGKSEIQYSEAPLNLQLTNLPEVFPVIVTGFLRTNDTSLQNWTEDWIEAIIRCLHNYNDNNISWIAYTGADRVDLYGENDETAKMVPVEFEVRIK
jgi:hypothetical protein